MPNATEEIKRDGYRALAVMSGSGVTLFSRRRSLNRQFSCIADALAEALAFGCPRKMGQEKGEKFMPYHMLSGIASDVVGSPPV
jgi:hypothetical protein